MRRLKPWHWVTIAFHFVIVVLLLWFALAYGGLPRLWSHHERKHFAGRDQIISYTAQDIPADPINLHLLGSRDAITRAFRQAGWHLADNVALWSALKIGGSVALDRPYPQAPVSNLYVQDAVQDLAFEKADGRSAEKRHHVRFWQVGPDQWLGAATFDRGVGLSLFTLQITHHIGPDVDGERDTIGRLIVASGGREIGREPSRISPGAWHRNGGGDKYRSDGMIADYRLSQG
ncbi:hypothetical protein FHS31_002024 [Sphingomonas vulcanisoli]|uniref:LssY-like C-terminal domain-containing protein n=1 Tax=Sphingomonas vulcanisoli TaxID=1658060 RepID=A0ABX0TSA2_9SPHN|nr:LssY C-terminal domain-containing protein [Sphingomonas vulcanisoli]NIJ08407.1 hypothetical protein [Sphingomonas vulcanisoli]